MVSGFLPTLFSLKLFSLKLQNLQAQNQRKIHQLSVRQLHKGGEFLITAAAVLCDGGLQGGQGDPQGAANHGDLLKENTEKTRIRSWGTNWKMQTFAKVSNVIKYLCCRYDT